MKFVAFGTGYLKYRNTYSVLDTNTLRLESVPAKYIFSHISQFENVKQVDFDDVYYSCNYELVGKVRDLWTQNLSAYEPSIYFTIVKEKDLFIWHNGKLYCKVDLAEQYMPVIDKNKLRIMGIADGYYRNMYFLCEMSLNEYKRTVLLDSMGLYRKSNTKIIDEVREIDLNLEM